MPALSVVIVWVWAGIDRSAFAYEPVPVAPCDLLPKNPLTEKTPEPELKLPKSPVLSEFIEPVADPDEAVVPVCVWLGNVASALPPVSSAVSNNALPASKPTGTRPAPKAVHVPKPSSVPGLVDTMAV